jgi:hypothetical protein
MSEYDWNLSAGAPLCTFSDSFYRTVREAIFQQLTTETTAEQWQAALESLTRLREELEQDVHPMHYGALVGRHRCVNHVFKEACARLRSLEIMQPAPEPQPPAPREPLTTPDAVVADLGETIQHRPDETVLGEDTENTP